MTTTQALVSQLHDVAAQAGGKVDSARTPEGGFSQVFSEALNSLSQYQDSAAVNAKRIELGDSQVGINDLMLSVQKATISLQLGVQVRNKMIAAYNEVMNMSV